jgi:Flp pilus assembly pilin Flp
MKIRSERGQGLTEYLILLMLVCVVSIAAVQSLGKEVKTKIQKVKEKINQEVTIDGD